jgi:hypothetical protein
MGMSRWKVLCMDNLLRLLNPVAAVLGALQLLLPYFADVLAFARSNDFRSC